MLTQSDAEDCYVANHITNAKLERAKDLQAVGAQEGIRAPTPLPALDPESSASASSATWAFRGVNRGKKQNHFARRFHLCQRTPARARCRAKADRSPALSKAATGFDWMTKERLQSLASRLAFAKP